uniref:G protein-coupled receptor n=1 Tax=Panagrolaimus sp. PS1159 TaxID=55785 RepID=A0AC35F4J9_9BILA
MFSSLNPNILLVYSQARTESTVIGFTIYSYFLLGGELIIGFLFLVIRIWNAYLFRRVRCKRLSVKEQRNLLSMKYQINETIEIMDTFLPIVIGQFCLYIFTIIGGMVIPVIFNNARPPILASLNEAVFIHLLSAHVFAIVRLHKIHQFPFCPCFGKNSASVNIAIKIEQMETNDDFYQRQKAMFDAQINFVKR